VVKRKPAVGAPATKKCVRGSAPVCPAACSHATLALLRYVIVGHCCESGDLMSPAPGEPETIDERELEVAEIGDLCVIEGRRVRASDCCPNAPPFVLIPDACALLLHRSAPCSGAYCAGMSTKNYNSFPEASEARVRRLCPP
jgi:hypothetical protein